LIDREDRLEIIAGLPESLVPPSLHEALRGRRAIGRDLTTLERLIASLVSHGGEPYAAGMDLGRVRALLDEAAAVLAGQMPLRRCGCEDPLRCTRCEGRQWITRSQYAAETPASRPAAD
jgi:hypothetical protein